MRVLVNPTPIVSAALLGAVFDSSFGVVVSLHANATAPTASTATRALRGLATEIKTSVRWNNERRRGDTDIVAPDAGSGGWSFLPPSETESPRNRLISLA